MHPVGAYQVGDVTDWVNWRCDECGHHEVMYGKVVNNYWHTRKRPTLTVVVEMAPLGGVLCRGISMDETLFRDALFADAVAACDYINRQWGTAYKCVFTLPGVGGGTIS
jgi:hypothetical protein